MSEQLNTIQFGSVRCYKYKDNPVIIFDGMKAGTFGDLFRLDQSIGEALKWAERETGQSAAQVRNVLSGAGFVWAGVGLYRWTVRRGAASCAGIRFESLQQVQKFRASVGKAMGLV